MIPHLPLQRTEVTGHVACHHGDPALARVLGLPERAPASTALVEALSAALRLPTSSATLRPSQAEVLREAWEYGGAFAPMQVGAGKSLPTFLLPTLLHARSPILVIPAALFGKTQGDFARYARDWRVRLPRLISYEEMGRDDRSGLLDELAPDLIVMDEAHNLRRDSARTRKFARYIAAARAAGRRLVVVALSGTLMTSSLVDYHHLAVWCLGDRAPLPVRADEAERWSAALDRDLGPLRRIGLGALADIPRGYHDWFRSRRGVVPTQGSDCGASIVVSAWRPEIPAGLRKTIDEVARSSMRPDDEILDELELPDCLAQLALGFWYRWEPAPPQWWLDPRREWSRYVRDVIEARVDGFDSPLQIVNALDREDPNVPDLAHGRVLRAAWVAVRDLFVPNTVPVWVDNAVLQQAAERVRRETAIAWVRPRAAGQKLAELGVPYYGADGPNPEHATGPIACSIPAHATGKNLQHYSRSLVLSLPANGDAWEQLIGRTHRHGQKADTVHVEHIDAIDYHRDVIDRVVAQARADAAASGFAYKLTLADFV